MVPAAPNAEAWRVWPLREMQIAVLVDSEERSGTVSAASPIEITDCEFCGAVGDVRSMTQWSSPLRSVFLHPECVAVLREMNAISETFFGEHRTTISAIQESSIKFRKAKGAA